MKRGILPIAAITVSMLASVVRAEQAPVETKSVGVVGADRKYRTFLSDPDMVWPDGITASPDGYMYVSASQVSAAAMFHGGKAENKAPYLIYRFKPLAAGYVSR